MEKMSSKIKMLLKGHNLIRYSLFILFRKKIIKRVNPCRFESLSMHAHLNYKPDLEKPKSFNERITYLKLYYKNNLWKQCADKLGSKKYLKSIGLEKYLPKTYAVYSNSNDINEKELPNKYVLKTNNDCGSVFIKNRDDINLDKIKKALNNSLRKNYVSSTNEWVYEDIEPKIFVEELLIPESGNDLIDYKFFTFNGEIVFINVISNRDYDVKNFSVDENYNLLPFIRCYFLPKKIMPAPKCFEEMKMIVKNIAKNFDFVRVDMYATKDGPRIGELTFFPSSGKGIFIPKKYDFQYGKYFDKTKLSSIFPK
ncbi:MAG: ATP-grasp fold amidoligase family protein [Candidatus Enteromonas sp.]|nr:ATP-grasp fold amidoligase family protein [Candidatus Enteromonas sp.]